ncbi:hypothetical protein [Sulfolobus acidocaldarius]|uniref:hypothetical protein n=1 Tax=Sulfolobus acidocaldarius TaxID=2285 RepID=UPI000780A9C6|nr:hypothetical protein [Sulfolobus acidocaldarius]
MSDAEPPCHDLHNIYMIAVVEGELVNETPLRVGQGRSSSFDELTDNPIMRRNGKPIIPG